jgi:porphobilinogen deaminase
MSRIPKSAQRAIDKANKASAARLSQIKEVQETIPLPREMDVIRTPRGVMNLHDVYFNDELQRLCVFASVGMGCIRRWSSGKGHVPDKDAKIEELRGKVEIRRKKL